ncbi:hypothetical protein BS78_01G323000 [Paspalum vaginatum]|nr:hypothetical protein BS78_01G323000 [Paspalum vaginatum]
MVALFSSLSAVVVGTVPAATAVVTEILPPCAALVGDIVAAAWASVAWFIYFLRALLAAAVAAAIGNLPYAAAAARSAVQALRLFVVTAMSLLNSLARVAKGVATVMFPAAWDSVAWILCRVWSSLATAADVAIDTLPQAAAAARNAAESASRGSRTWAEPASKLLHELYGWLITVTDEELPGAARAAKNAAGFVAKASQPWLAMVSRLSRGLYGWLAAIDTAPYAAAAESAARASQSWLEPASNPLHELYRWLVTAVETLPGAARAAKAAAWPVVEASQPWVAMRDLYRRLVAAVADKLKTDACAAAASEKLSADAAAVLVAPIMDSTAEASAELLHWWSWFLRDHGVELYVLLAVALVAVAFVSGGAFALTLRSRLQDDESRHDRRRSRLRRHDCIPCGGTAPCMRERDHGT